MSEFEFNKVRAVAVTKPLIDMETSEDFISFAARVSNPTNQMNFITSDRLIKYLIREKHWSPFEMANLVLEVETTRDIGRQMLRHTFKFQEFSQRYANPTDSLYFVDREARLQDHKNRQNSLENEDDTLQAEWSKRQMAVIGAAKDAYRWAINSGIAKEQARAVLPEGNTITRMYVNGYVRTWIHYCDVRMDPTTQKEHRDLATKCWNELIVQFPAIAAAYKSLSEAKDGH